MQSPYGRTPIYQQQQQPKQSNNNLFWILLLAVVVFFLYRNGYFDKKVDPQPNPNDQVIVDPVDPIEPDDSQKHDAKDTYVVRIYESKTKAKWLLDQVNNEKFWTAELMDMGISKEYFDPIKDDGSPNPDAASFVAAADKRGIKPPFWIHAKGGAVLSITPFSESVGVETWRKIIKRSLKD